MRELLIEGPTNRVKERGSRVSALRIARPGYPVQLIDLGAAVGRVRRVGVYGSGELVPSTGPRLTQALTQQRLAQMAARRAKRGETA